MPVSISEDTPRKELETGRVALWRLEQFRSLGFSDAEAIDLAGSDVDLQLMRSLVAAKCPRHLALRIAL